MEGPEVEALCRAVVRSELGVEATDVTPVDRGNSNHVLRVGTGSGTAFVVRVSKLGPSRFTVERAAMAAVAGRVPVPEVRYVGVAPGRPDVDVMVADWVDAPSLADRPGRDAPERRAVARSLAEVLAAVHSVPVDGFGSLDEHLRGSASDIVSWFVDGAEARVAASAAAVARHAPTFADLPHAALERLRAGAGELGGPAMLVHGDVSPANLLVRGPVVAALVDWEGVKGGPPALDLGWLRYVDPDLVVDHDELARAYAALTVADPGALARAGRLVEVRILATEPEWLVRAGRADGVAATMDRLRGALAAL